ncbi:MAG: aromatic amino acid lyase [Lacisediminihabitans sp.]
MLEINGTVQLADIVKIACQNEHITISESTRNTISDAHERAGVLSTKIPTYGRTTGVGANRLTNVSEDDSEHGLRLLRSHAVDAGAPLEAPAVRAMLAVRLNQLCRAGSGIDPDILDALVTMLNDDALPSILEYGAIGTGDLSALAGTALTMMGEREASRPFDAMTMWGNDNALPFISSSALTLGRACLVSDRLRKLYRASTIIFALSFVGLRGNRSPLSTAAAEASASPCVATIATRIRSLLGPSGESARIQDPYGLRAFPVTMAPFIDALSKLEAQIQAVANTAQENPLFTSSDVIHHAGFYQAALALDLDSLALALAQSTPLTLSRIRMMNEPDYTGQSPFLATGRAGSSGLMVIEYVAAAAHAEIHANSHPSTLTTVVLSRGTEEDASFAPTGVSRLERSVRPLRILLGCELVSAIRLLRQRGVVLEDMASDLMRQAFEIGCRLSPEMSDRDLRPDLTLAEYLVGLLSDLD